MEVDWAGLYGAAVWVAGFVAFVGVVYALWRFKGKAAYEKRFSNKD
jgi:hypothetical protein